MKPKRANKGDIYVPQGLDLCQTPAYALDPLLPYLKGRLWEPACGEGFMVDALNTAGFTVVSSDLLTGQNFFFYEPETYDMLVTNPPYSIKYKWLKRCYELDKPFALLMPVEVLGAVMAQKLFRERGIEVIFLPRRVNFKMPNKDWDSHAQFPVAWYCYKFNIGRQMKFYTEDTCATDTDVH
jgi:hypothetical protein